MRARIAVTRALPGPAVDMLRAVGDVDVNPYDRALSAAELHSLVIDADAVLCLITDALTSSLLDAAPRLLIAANYAVGYNNIDLAAATARGVMVTNTPDVLTESTADMAFALMLAVCRRLIEGDALMRRHAYPGWGPSYMLGSDVNGKTLGIVGMGRIGQAMARRAVAFNMPVLYCPRPDGGRPLPDSVAQSFGARATSFESVLTNADIVSLHVPYSLSTHHLIDESALAHMKPTAYLINTARGPIVNESALIHALQSGLIAGAGLDVFEHEPDTVPGLTDLPNVVLAPHLGSATLETRTLMGTTAARNIIDALAGQQPPNLVNRDVWGRRKPIMIWPTR